MFKLLALDLDGTLVSEQLTVSARVRNALRRVLEETDIRVVIATGRMFPSALAFANTLGIREPLITYQGAMIRDQHNGRRVLYHQPVPLDTARALIGWLQAQGYHPNIYINDEIITLNNPHYVEWYAKSSGAKPVLVDDLLPALTEGPTKILVMEDDPNRLEGLMATLGSQFQQMPLTWCKSRVNFCEINHRDVSKWAAIEALSRQWEIPAAAIMAIGDQGNDASMLRQAGLGVAMGNAPETVKAIADVVTGTIDEDGAAQAIEEYILKSLVAV
jgi:Cof subfamily protein (haloacid dehalogenase superfamily)